VNAAHNNWDVLVPFFLMAQRATPSTATGYSPFFLLHGREMTLPSNEDLKAKIPITDRNLKQQMEKLKASLRQAYMEATVANRQAHQTNKRYYDRRAKRREFKTGDWVYLYNPAIKPVLSRKFFKPWSGPFQITAKLSELNYEIRRENDRKSVVRINRLKLAHGEIDRDSNPRPQYRRRMRKREQSVSSHGSDQSETVNIGARSFPKQIPRNDDIPPNRGDSPGRSHVLEPLHL